MPSCLLDVFDGRFNDPLCISETVSCAFRHTWLYLWIGHAFISTSLLKLRRSLFGSDARRAAVSIDRNKKAADELASNCIR